MKKRALAFMALVVVLGCKTIAAKFPVQHREHADACSSAPRPPGWNTDAAAGHSGQCERDADCTAGRNGRCSAPGHAPSTCTYDACMNDSECGAQKVCECTGGGNRCVSANCHTDSDCGGLGCSPTRAEMCGNMGGTVGYYCHTKKDDCIEDSDCKDSGMCVYSPAGGKWTCNHDSCVG